MDKRKNRYKQLRRRRRFRRRIKVLLSATVIGIMLFAALAHRSEGRTNDLPKTVFHEPEEIFYAMGELQTSQQNPSPAPAVTKDPADTEDWRLVLVNRWNPLPENYSVQTVELRNGLQVDARCYPDLQAMVDACRTEGLSPVICSAYRTQECQEQLYQAAVQRQLSQGFSQANAETEAGWAVAIPGTSEHQTGLAVDIVDINNQLLDESQESTTVQKWLMEHSWEYGFILRYPNGKSEMTGIIYEPWHYRYVGRENAEQIYASGICLEEYLEGTCDVLGKN